MENLLHRLEDVVRRMQGARVRHDLAIGQEESELLSSFVASVRDLLVEVHALLQSLGYRTKGPPIQPVNAGDLAWATQWTIPPILLRMWIDMGSIDLRGRWDVPVLEGKPRIGNEAYADPLVVYGPRDSLDEPSYQADSGQLPWLDISPDACLKAGYSGGEPTTISLPTHRLDPLLASAEWPPNTTFGQMIVRSLSWGGLPGLIKYPREAQVFTERLRAAAGDSFGGTWQTLT